LTRAAPAPPPKKGGRKPARKKPAKKSQKAKEAEARQRRLDLVGLGLIAMSVYLGYVVYLGWDGGTLGRLSDDGLLYAVGAGSVFVPAACALIGLALILRPVIAERRAPGVGFALISCGILLALAAQTAGLGAAGQRGDLMFDANFIQTHGGGIGEALYWATDSAIGRVGSHITAILAVLLGALLISGRSISDLGSVFGRGARKANDNFMQFATAVRETGMKEDDDLIATEPAETERIFGPPEPVVAGAAFDDEGAEPIEAVEEPDAEEDTTGDLPIIPPEPEGEEPRISNFDDAIAMEGEDEEKPELVPLIPLGELEDDELTPQGNRRSEHPGVTTSEEIDYDLPTTESLQHTAGADTGPAKKDLEEIGRTLLETLTHFKIEAKIVGIVSGPHVSRFELRLAPGTKVSKITQLSDDLAYALASTDIRILAPIPGKQAVGVEVPNPSRKMVRLGDIYGGRPKGSSPMVAWLGKDIAGNAIWTDLQKMPHVLVAGTTGSGKSGCVNAVLTSMLLHASPNELRLVLVDPKQVELNHYEAVPHLLTPVVTSPKLAANVLQNLIVEMESRYSVMSEARARSLDELNRVRRKAGEAPLPYILCVIDELADLMMVAPAEVEDAIIRLAQKSRAVGIHLLLATQRPSTDIITGTIKVNIPARIAFAVSSQIDSRVILDGGGAEALLGQGDMLFRPAGTGKLQRIQGAFITEDEIAKVTEHWAKQGEPDFEPEMLEAPAPEVPEGGGAEDEMSPDRDDLLEEAAKLVVESQSASVSMIQRRFRVGYTRAGRLIDMLERRGIISGYEGSKPRQVLVSHADLPRILGNGADEVLGEADAAPEPVRAE
jgi:S-DNA-T family DNA segregation ATPase FtsK/SpoIIIE